MLIVHIENFYKLVVSKTTNLKSFIADQGLTVFILLILFVISFIIQLIFYALYYRRAILGKNSSEPSDHSAGEPVSIIICARNEAENLKKNLPLILEQDYPHFEVIVVDDHSEDETEDVLAYFAAKYTRLRIAKVKNEPKFIQGKKLALMIGIKAAKNDWLLLTDADCQPAGKNWLAMMQKNFRKSTSIVLGYGAYRSKPGFLNMVIRYETAFTAMQYFGMAKAGKPYMGVGRNLAYRKSLFFSNNGFGCHTGLQSGDDDLFVNSTANGSNTAVEMNPDSFTYSDPKETFNGWYRQKQRHLTTASRYNQDSKARLIAENVSRMILLISSLALIICSPYIYIILAAYFIIVIIKSMIFSQFCNLLNERYLILPSLILEPVFPFFYSFLHASNYLKRNKTVWK
jgi:cellulose synthase/poly-beta-1,6-N-acetylglucosamine synthase-like glycosyltransferase